MNTADLSFASAEPHNTRLQSTCAAYVFIPASPASQRSIYHTTQAQNKEMAEITERLARVEKMLSKLVGEDDLPKPAVFAPVASAPPS
jgi:hypothetical protein